MVDKVYFGGTVGFDDVTNPTNIAALVATGTAGLYMHEDAMNAAYQAGELPAIAKALGGTTGGEIELGLTSDGVGFFAGWYKMVVTDNGFAPTEANVNCNFSAPTFLSDWKDFVGAGKAAGLQTIAPVFSPNTGTIPADGWADPSYNSIKTAALQGGALAIDAPPAFFLSQGSAYQNFTENEIQWAHQNNLRVSVILSPYDDDSKFQSDAATMVSMLTKAGTLPTDWAVENYNASDPTRVGSDTDPNSVAGVALWVAQHAPTSSSPGTAPPIVLGSGTDQLALSVSEDAYKGNAQFTVAVDGKQVGGVQTATASHSAGQSQVYDVDGNFGSGQHAVTVSFLNDAYDGTPSTDRNLYVTGASYDGTTQPVSFVEYSAGSHGFEVASSSVDTTGAAGGSLTTTGDDTVQAGSGAVTVTGAGPSVSISGGAGTLRFIAQGGDDTVSGGSGNQTLAGGTGSLDYIAGHGNATVTAGSGRTTFTIDNGDAGGTLTINDFRTGSDSIQLSGYAAATEIKSHAVSGGSTTIQLSDNTTIHLVGVAVSNPSTILG